jgi:RNA-directed DNA polymerase
MKRHGNLWHKVVSLENIKLAHTIARRGKAFYTEVQMVDADVDKYAREVQAMLVNKTFTTSPYEVEDRFDGRKMRTIYKLPYYPDRIVQHAMLNIVGPILVNTFIRDTFQSIQGRGTHDAARRVKRLIQSENCPKYALKVDIRKYYPSVDNERMKVCLRKKIKDPDVLWLADDVIDSMQGLPIGNYTSQHFGNLFLNDFDWWMKQQIKPVGYYRYCDDILIFGNSTKELVEIQKLVIKRLSSIGLEIKPSWNIYDVYKNGVDFVGFVFRPTDTRLRPSIAVKFKTKCEKLKMFVTKLNCAEYLSVLMAYKGWMQRINAKQLWRKHTTQFVKFFPKQLRSAL